MERRRQRLHARPAGSGRATEIDQQAVQRPADSDISAVADPHTGVAVYDSYAPGSGQPFGFIFVGGTSAASPFIGRYARAPANAKVIGPNTIYAAPGSSLYDVRTGTNAGLRYCPTVGVGNAVCAAGVGWDGPTGRGTPCRLAPFGS